MVTCLMGMGLLDHGLEHLGGAEDGHAKLIALGGHLFLGDLLCGDLNLPGWFQSGS